MGIQSWVLLIRNLKGQSRPDIKLCWRLLKQGKHSSLPDSFGMLCSNIFCRCSAIPASALNEEESDDEDEVLDDNRDDERSGTRYNVSYPHVSPSNPSYNPRLYIQYAWFHIIFAIAAMYVAMLLTDWYIHPFLY
jgi:hypothetical protein